jgi:hypothetical protein
LVSLLSGDRSSFLGVNVHVWRRVVISPNGPCNRLLAAFPKTDLDLLRPHLELVRLDMHHVLEEPGHLISHVYFIESGLISIVGTTKPTIASKSV